MNESSSAAQRAIRILGFLAAHPTEAFTLSDLCRRLDLNRASADRVVRALSAARFLDRHPRHLTYSLGISLVAVGHAAAVRHPVVAAARRAMEALSGELGLDCNAVSVDATGSLVVAETGRGLLGVGARLPPLPMMGLVHAAFAAEERRAAWLASMRFEAREADFLRGALAAIAGRGFAAALRGPVRERVRGELTRLLDTPEDREARERLRALWRQASQGELQLLAIDRSRDYAVAYVSAPVFDSAGQVALELVLRKPPERLTGSQLEALADRLRDACDGVTQAIHGRAPAAAA